MPRTELSQGSASGADENVQIKIRWRKCKFVLSSAAELGSFVGFKGWNIWLLVTGGFPEQLQLLAFGAWWWFWLVWLPFHTSRPGFKYPSAFVTLKKYKQAVQIISLSLINAWQKASGQFSFNHRFSLFLQWFVFARRLLLCSETNKRHGNALETNLTHMITHVPHRWQNSWRCRRHQWNIETVRHRKG